MEIKVGDYFLVLKDWGWTNKKGKQNLHSGQIVRVTETFLDGHNFNIAEIDLDGLHFSYRLEDGVFLHLTELLKEE